MKRKTLLLVCLAICVHILASGVSPEQARAIAQSFLTQHRPSVLPHQMKMVPQRASSHRVGKESCAYYVFNVGNEDGFIVVSGDDRTAPVLGYAHKGSFEEETMPANMRAWLDDYSAQIDYLNSTVDVSQRPRLIVSNQAIAPMLTSHWGQNAPYNDLCPTDPSTKGRCATGCVATALAQVIYYHKYPEATKEWIPGYYTDTQKIWVSSSAVTTIDWKYLLDSYQGKTTSTQRNAVAKLMSLCGKAVNMDYNESASGAITNSCVKALQTYFGYDKTTRVLNRTAFSGDEWESLIYEELASGRPVLYGGTSSGGGHAFVVDGYDGEGFFHINWGWNGESDGYFQLSVLNPYNTESTGASSSDDGFSFNQRAVVGIQHGSGELVAERFTAYNIQVSGSDSFTRLSANKDFTGIGIQTEVVNITGDTHQFNIGLALCDSKEDMLSIIAQQGTASSVKSYYGGTKTFSACSFGANLPDGDYVIIPVSKTENSADWEPCWGSNTLRIKAVIKDNTLTLSNPVVSLAGTIQPIGAVTEFENCQIKAQIVNNGTRFIGDIYLFDGSTRVAGRTLEVEEGETANFTIDYIPTSAGDKILILAYDDGEQFVPITYQTLSVNEDVRTVSLEHNMQLTNVVGRTVKEDKVVVKVYVENKGDAYDNTIKVNLYKLNVSDGRYESVANQTKLLSLSETGKTSLDFTFENLEHQTEYLVVFSYRVKGKWLDGGWSKYATFDTDLPQPKIVGKVSVRNADSNGNVPETAAYVKAVFVNAGGADMIEGRIDICLEKYDEDKQEYAYFQNAGFTFDHFVINEADSFFMGFKNLVPETKYRARLRYYVGENGEYMYVDGSEQYFKIADNAQTKDYHLAVTYSLPNVEDGVMTGDKLNYNIQVKNDGKNNYDLTVFIRIFEIDDYGEYNFFSEIHHDVTLPIGGSTSISSKTPKLLEGHRYLASCYYLDFEGTNSSAPWVFVESKQFRVGSALSSVKKTPVENAAAKVVTVWSVDGHQVGTMALDEINRLPRGLYVIRSEKGTKKFVKH